MRITRGGNILDEAPLLRFNELASEGYSVDKKVQEENKYTIALSVSFSKTEFDKILQYDNERNEDNEKIILGTTPCDNCDNNVSINNNNNFLIINPINLKWVVKSGSITNLEIDVQKGNRIHLLQSTALDLIGDCEFKSLHITTDMSFILTPSGAENIIMLINRYKGTLNQLELHFGTVGMTILSKIYEEVENWIINAPITVNASLTAKCIDYKPVTSIHQTDSLDEGLKRVEYDDMQKKLQFLMDCKRFSERFKTTKEKEERDVLCAEIVNNNLEFIESFDALRNCMPSKIKKAIGDDDIYNTFNRIIPDDTPKEYIYVTDELHRTFEEIYNSRENNNNSTTEDDVNLTTSGTTADRGDCCIIS